MLPRESPLWPPSGNQPETQVVRSAITTPNGEHVGREGPHPWPRIIRVIRHYWLAFGQRARKSTAGCLMR